MQLFNGLDVDCAVGTFYDVLFSSLEMFVPVVLKRDSKYPKWFTREIIDHIDYLQFDGLRRQFKTLIRKAYNQYIYGVGQDLLLQPQNFCNFVRGKSKTRDLPLPLKYGAQLLNNAGNVCNAIIFHLRLIGMALSKVILQPKAVFV